MPTMGDTVPGASALFSWKSVRGRPSGPNRPQEITWAEAVKTIVIIVALIAGGAVLLSLIYWFL